MRLSDLPEYEREHLLAQNLKPLGPPAWTPLSDARFRPIARRETALGEALIEFYRLFRRRDDAPSKAIARIIVPREAVGEATGGRR